MTGRPVTGAGSASAEVRPCDATLRSSVLALLVDCGLPEAGLADHWNTTWVAVNPEAPHEVLGVVALEVHGRAALLRSLATRADSRSKGLGQKLFSFAMGRAVDLDLDAVALLTTTAEPFFASRGFARVSRDAAPQSLMASAEFSGACPASATVMMRRLR